MFFFQKFRNHLSCQYEIKDYNEKRCSWFSETVWQKVHFMAYGTHIDDPPAWELTEKNLIFETVSD